MHDLANQRERTIYFGLALKNEVNDRCPLASPATVIALDFFVVVGVALEDVSRTGGASDRPRVLSEGGRGGSMPI